MCHSFSRRSVSRLMTAFPNELCGFYTAVRDFTLLSSRFPLRLACSLPPDRRFSFCFWARSLLACGQVYLGRSIFTEIIFPLRKKRPGFALIWEIFTGFEVRSLHMMLQHSTAGELAFSASTRVATMTRPAKSLRPAPDIQRRNLFLSHSSPTLGGNLHNLPSNVSLTCFLS